MCSIPIKIIILHSNISGCACDSFFKVNQVKIRPQNINLHDWIINY